MSKAGSGVEKALYRLMQLPGGEILFRRPPRETVPALTALAASDKSLRRSTHCARWKRSRRSTSTPPSATGRPGRSRPTIRRRAPGSRRLLRAPAQAAARNWQRSKWWAKLRQARRSAGRRRRRSDRGWPGSARSKSSISMRCRARRRRESTRIVDQRYPHERSLYARQWRSTCGEDFSAATDLIARYRTAFPDDKIFPVEAEAELATGAARRRTGSPSTSAASNRCGRAELVKSYFALVLAEQERNGNSPMRLRASSPPNPGDLRDAARLFYLYQQQGQIDSAKAVLNSYREQKDARGAAWNARTNSTRSPSSSSRCRIIPRPRVTTTRSRRTTTHRRRREKGLVGLARICSPLRSSRCAWAPAICALSQHRHHGPWARLPQRNSFAVSQHAGTATTSTQPRISAPMPYFHRAKAAELLGEIDTRFPNAPERAQLHAKLMDAYAAYGENDCGDSRRDRDSRRLPAIRRAACAWRCKWPTRTRAPIRRKRNLRSIRAC